MRIGIMGTRGIPNRYGGFEQFAEELSRALVKRGYDVTVYNSSLHGYEKEEWNGVKIITCRDREDKLGAFGQFTYDRNCLRDARNQDFDVLLHLGYTSDSIWHRLWPRNCLNVVNMDGLEWRRKKYNWATKKFLKRAESLAARHADVIVADNPEIKIYLEKKYALPATYIPYPAEHYHPPKTDTPKTAITNYGLQEHRYYLSIARMEPENNLHLIIEGFIASKSPYPLVIVGNTANKYGTRLRNRYETEGIRFIGTVYEKALLNELRYFSSIYFHGHSVGGTNPALLEAMGCGCRIAAHDNEFNRYVLREAGSYFTNANDVRQVILNSCADHTPVLYPQIETEYALETIVDMYEEVFNRKKLP